VLWILRQEEHRFSRQVLRILARPDRGFFVSIVSIWEIALKRQAGKLRVDEETGAILDIIRSQSAWHILQLEIPHIQALNDIARFSDHTDPFDRMLIAQARSEKLNIITADSQFPRYGVDVVW
jgi:PIN domain nuclease of toxin-antitoxin system